MGEKPSKDQSDSERWNGDEGAGAWVPSSRAELGTRLKRVIDLIGGYPVAAEVCHKSAMQLRRYVSGEAEPPVSVAVELASAAGVSAGWLVTGQGAEMAVSGHHDATDPELLGRLWEGVTGVYSEENQRIAPVQQARLVARMYDRLAVIVDPVERRGALRYALEDLRQDIRTAAIAPASSKRPA